MATKTFWVGNSSAYSYKRGAVVIPAKTLVKLTALEMSTEPGLWVAAQITAGNFTEFKDVTGVPSDKTTSLPIDQTKWRTVNQNLINESKLEAKYQELLKAYDTLYAAVVTNASPAVTGYPLPGTFNLTYWKLAQVEA